ncbi:outer membrane protein assembly factor BamE [Conservatibacter flavescens]|uniref:Outer membrane protein assembly factor BamE n=1 Tax=Conservatibacter flavescens TaxID=28161 RepID=A0A2M8S1L7_9PAST|nr:outer membrane protein assembly factor BamE [Conservatibacter flavescens]PJG85051.1 outer membrane protein assembly factor BamE [Conservatibacter flavescens]
MQLKSIISALVLALSVTSCSTVSKLVYRIDVPQGNFLEASKVAQLQTGMNDKQVQYLLGTPMLTDPFGANTWYYVYLEQRGYETPEQHTLTVNFNQRNIVTDFHLDKPLPDDSQVAVNNAIIESQKTEPRRWWKFWQYW